MLIINLIKVKTTMEDEKKCAKCGHEHKADGTCECGCGGE